MSTSARTGQYAPSGLRQICRSPGLLLVLWLVLGAAVAQALPETKRVNSVKSLTNILSQIEKDNGARARFVTVKLQVRLEDVYISKGTAVVLQPKKLSQAIDQLLNQGKSRAETAKIILKRYHDGEFHEQ